MSDLKFALLLADEADQITLSRYRAQDLFVETKPDNTPVTEADRATENMLREKISAKFPDDGIIGEEFGSENAAASRLWVLDPIDGTKNYLRGVPVWGTLIALVVNDEPVVGVVSCPALGRRWWAEKGGGAFTRDVDGTTRAISVSGVANISDASFSYSDEIGWESYGSGNAFSNLKNSVWRTRAYGDFWSHLLVAEGAVDIAAEPVLNKWDMAANNAIVLEAGGTVTGFTGGSAFAEGNAVTTNGLLHNQVISLIKN
jgi:histidinol-phosphatase